MGEPEVDPGAPPGQPGTLAPQCDTAVANPETHAPAPLSPIATNEAAVLEAEDKEDATLAGDGDEEGDGSAVPEVVVGDGNEQAGDGGLSVKEAEATEAQEEIKLEVESSSVEVLQPAETEPLQEAEIAGTEDVVKEEGSQMDNAVKGEEGDDGDDDQTKLSVEEVPVVAGSDDAVPKEEGKEEQEDLMEESERKGEDVMDQETVSLDASNKEADEVQLEDKNPSQDEGDGDKAMEENVRQDGDGDGDKVMEENVTQDGDGDKVMKENLTQDEEDGDKVMGENLAQDGGGDDKAMEEELPEDIDVNGNKVMDEDITPDGDDDKVVNEKNSIDGNGDGLDDDDAADGDGDKEDKHEQDVMETNEGEVNEDEDEDEPPPLPVKKSGGGGGKKKRPRPTRIKKGEEELCFICFDGGELVVCDRR